MASQDSSNPLGGPDLTIPQNSEPAGARALTRGRRHRAAHPEPGVAGGAGGLALGDAWVRVEEKRHR